MTNNLKTSELPRGWVLVSLGEITESINPGFPSGAHNQSGKGVPHLRPMNVSYYGKLDLSELKYVDVENYEQLKHGDILFNNTNSPALLGKTAVIKKTGNFAYSNHMTRIRLIKNTSASEYIGWYLHYLFWKGFFKLNCTNHVNQASINKSFLENRISIPLPPLAEQHRIVAKIEELFSDLDEGIASLKKAQTQLKTYRQAVLKYAFEGKLTAAWRQQHKPEPAEKLLAQIKVEREKQNVGGNNGKTKKPKEFPPLTEAELAELPELPEGWRWVRVAEISDAIGGYAFKSKEFAEQGKYQVIKIANVKMGRLILESHPSFLQKVDDDILEKYELRSGDCVVTLTGTRKKRDYGFVARIKTEKNLLLNQRLAALRFHAPPLHTSYFYYALMSEHFQNNFFKHETGNVGQGNVSMKAITEETIALPPLTEQHQIVQEIESRLSVCDKLEESLKDSLQKAEALRQSILKKAFEGKLVPQDPNDEPAEKLLARIRAQKAQAECKL